MSSLLVSSDDNQLPVAYTASDLNIVPTRAHEGFGLVAAEALAAGTPSVVTPIGGLPEIIGPLSSDLILRSSQQDDIADGIIHILSGRVSLPDSITCKDYAVRHFSSRLMASRTASVYRELCG